MGAAYEWSSSCTDDETYIREPVLIKPDGTAFEVNDYAFEFVITGCGENLLLTEGSGITKNAVTGKVSITPGVDYRFKPGTYRLGFRKRNLLTSQVDQIADGTLTVTEGNFNG